MSKTNQIIIIMTAGNFGTPKKETKVVRHVQVEATQKQNSIQAKFMILGCCRLVGAIAKN